MSRSFVHVLVVLFWSFVLIPNGQADGVKNPQTLEINSDTLTTSEFLTKSTLYEDSGKLVNLSSSINLPQAIYELESKASARTLKEIVGYGGAQIWLKVELINLTSDSDFILRYSYSAMQNIEAYLFDNKGILVTHQLSGKLIEPEKRPLNDSEYLFRLKLVPNQPFTLLLRFESTGSIQLPLSLLSHSKMHRETQKRYIFYGLYYGAIFVILMYSLSLFLTSRKPLFLSYFLYILSAMIAQASLHGIAYSFIWPSFPNWNKISTIFLIGIMFINLSVFTSLVLETKSRTPRFHPVLYLFGFVSALISICSLFAYGATIIHLTGILTSILPLVFLPVGILACRNGNRFGYFFLAGIVFYTIGVSLYAIKDTGFVPGSFLTENGVLIGSFLEIIIFSLGIALHLRSVEKSAASLKQELDIAGALSLLASQVAHDIRSPLSALDVATNDLSGLQEDKRILVRSAVSRIKDISNNLLQRNREVAVGKPLSSRAHHVLSVEPVSPQLVLGLVDGIVSEKRAACRGNSFVEITSTFPPDVRGDFALIQPTEFKRVVSNLLNNAIEAIGPKGSINVSVERQRNFIDVTIKDNGGGIPSDVIEKVGQRGNSFGKANGNGLGLYHAKTVTESWGGQLGIVSDLGIGTSISIKLPVTIAPNWFLSELILQCHSKICVMDDDISIKEVWKQRFADLGVTENGIEVSYFSHPDEVERWATDIGKQNISLFLLDFEITNSRRSGIELARDLDIGSRAVLVSSRWEEKEIQNQCNDLKMKLLPKGLAGFVAIQIKKPMEKFDAVLLDDDNLVISTWQTVARKNQKYLRTFSEHQEFLRALNTIDRTTPLYVDSNLSGGLKGQDLIPQIKELGFQTIHLATGFDSSHFDDSIGATSIVNKMPPLEWDSHSIA